jgi:hypothetical protein
MTTMQHSKPSVKKPALLAGFILFMLCVPLHATAQQAGGARPHVELPDEPVRSAIFENCSACHGIDEYAYNALDATGWSALIDNQHKQQRDLAISPEHEAILLDYLVENFGPNTIAFPREYIAPEITDFFSDTDARVFLENVCAECHEIRVFGQRNNTEQWRNLVLEMRENGASLSNENLERLVEWLGRVRGPLPVQLQ